MSEIRQIQVDGINYDLVITEDEVSATRAEQAAAQSRQFANESIAARNSASSYADAAEDAADRAEAIVGGEFVSYGQAQGLSSAQKQQARDNIGVATSSNPNLLDNAWFINPVNTRGKSSYGASEYTIDRWRTWADISVTLADGGLSLTSTNNGGGLFQYLDSGSTVIAGKTVTFSAIIDGVLYSCTGVFTKPAWIATTVPNSGVSIVLVYPDEYPNELISASIRLDGAISTPVVVQAMKLEIGAVSTLLQDGPPNCGIELARSIYSKADPNDPYANNGFGRSNRNLLDNWYFVGGGSQLGDGVFPINQRGQTSYAGGSGIDRWVSDSQITLTASGITISANALFQNQSKEFFDGILGETVTYSILTTGGEIKSATIQFPSSYPASIQVQEIFNDGQSSIGFALFPAGNGQVIRIIGAPIAAAKLEEGTVSTLANDAPPDFGEELRKCQRYLYIMGGAPYTMFGSGIAETASYIMANIQFPVPMRATPTLTVSSAFRIWGGVGYEFGVGGISISSATQIAANCPYAGVACSVSAGNLTVGNIYYLQANNDINSKLIFSAEL